MDLRQVRYFIAVAEELHIGRAAEKLHITQPPLTRQIKQLEEELEVLLFKRTPKGVELTPAGEALLPEAVTILKQTTRAVARAKLAQAGKLGRLDIAYYGSPIYKIIPNLLERFSVDFPNVEITLQHMSKTAQIEALGDKMIHIGFSRSIPETPGIVTQLVCQEPLMVAVGKNLPLSGLTEVGIEDLATTPLVLFPSRPRPSFADSVFGLCKDAGFHPNVATEAEDAASCLCLVAAGIGAAIVPESVSTLAMEGVFYIPLLPQKKTTDLQCIYNKYNRTPIVDCFLEMINVARLDANKQCI